MGGGGEHLGQDCWSDFTAQHRGPEGQGLMIIVMMIMIIIMMTGHTTDVRHALGSLGRGPGEGVEGLERLEETRR